jgi:hypothetical protein
MEPVGIQLVHRAISQMIFPDSTFTCNDGNEPGWACWAGRNHREIHRKMEVYPLVNIQKPSKNSGKSPFLRYRSINELNFSHFPIATC